MYHEKSIHVSAMQEDPLLVARVLCLQHWRYVALPITRSQTLKFSYSSGTYDRFGGNYKNASVAWQYSC